MDHGSPPLIRRALPLVTNRGFSTCAVSESLLPAGGYQAQQLVGYVRCQEGCDLGGVVGRIHLDDVAAGEVEAHKPPHELLSLAAREAPDLRRPRAWRERRVYEIHIEGYVSLRVPYPLARTGYSLQYTYLSDLVRAYELEAQLPGIVPVTGVVQRTSHSDLDRALGFQEPLLDGASEGRPVGVLLAEVGVPGVRVTVELHEGQRSVHGGCGPQLRQGDRVVAAEHYGDDACAVYGLETFSYPPVALLDVAWDYGEVAVVYDRQMIEDRDILRRVVGPEQVRNAADALRAEARPYAEGRGRIKGSSDYRSVAILKILGVWQSHESAHPAETWALERVGRFVVRHVYLPY